MSGSIKLDVPICTAFAPASKNSLTSLKSLIPPQPITGMLTCFVISSTILNATGFKNSPEIPP